MRKRTGLVYFSWLVVAMVYYGGMIMNVFAVFVFVFVYVYVFVFEFVFLFVTSLGWSRCSLKSLDRPPIIVKTESITF